MLFVFRGCFSGRLHWVTRGVVPSFSAARGSQLSQYVLRFMFPIKCLLNENTVNANQGFPVQPALSVDDVTNQRSGCFQLQQRDCVRVRQSHTNRFSRRFWSSRGGSSHWRTEREKEQWSQCIGEVIIDDYRLDRLKCTEQKTRPSAPQRTHYELILLVTSLSDAGNDGTWVPTSNGHTATTPVWAYWGADVCATAGPEW